MLNNRLQRENLHTSESASEPQSGTQPLLVQPERGDRSAARVQLATGTREQGREGGGRRNRLALSHRVAVGRNGPEHVSRWQQERWGRNLENATDRNSTPRGKTQKQVMERPVMAETGQNPRKGAPSLHAP